MNNIGNNLKRFRLLNNLSLKESGKLLNMSAPAVSKYEKGQLIPNSKKLIEFANAYKVKTIDILKSYNAPKMKFTSFRKKERLKGKNLLLLQETIQNEVSNYLEVIEMSNLNRKKISLKKYNCSSIEDAEQIAIKFRQDYNLSNTQPIFDLINTLENIGIIIIQIKNINNKFSLFDGLSEYINGFPVIVTLDDTTDGARQRFTIAHELGHLLLNVNDENIDEEKMCNKFASSLLMPKDAVINEFGIQRDNISFFELKAFKLEYKVSLAAIIYRLRDLNIISEYLFRKLNIYLSKKGYKTKEPYNIETEKTYQFKKLVHKLEINQIISLNKACELLGITINEYNEENNNSRY